MMTTWDQWRAEVIRNMAHFEAHVQECERLRREDQITSAERHQENLRRLEAQDRLQERVINDLTSMRGEMSKQFTRMLYAVGGCLISVFLSLLGFIIQHAFK